MSTAKSVEKSIYNKKGNVKLSVVVKELLKCVREYKKASILSIVFITLETAFECIIPFVMGLMVNALESANTNDNILNEVIMYAVILIILAFCSLACGITAGRISAKASVGFATNVRKDLFYKISRFSFNNIDKFQVSSLVTRQTTDIYYLQMSYMLMIRIALRAPLMFIFSIIMACVQAASMSWIFAITIPVLAVALAAIIVTVMPIFIRVFAKYDKLNESVEENVRGIRVVKTYVREEYEKEKFKKSSEDIRNDFVKAERRISLSNPLMYITMYLSMALVIGIGSMIIFNTATVGSTEMEFGDINVGQISSLITYGAQILSSLLMISNVFVMVSMSMASMRRVYEVLVEKPTINEPEHPVLKVETGDIDFDNVNFKYTENAEKYALSNINLHIKEGETVGIIGGTGSSKSTLVNLISRFYDTTTGEVKVGGKNVKEYSLLTLRSAVSMVLQKNILFSGTIKDNLKWGNKNATDEEIVNACKIAQADSFVEAFPDKYDTQILQGGTNVSGGQKQRLCIARAILKNPKILILDDSTSAVDTKTDAFIRDGLRKTLPNTTKIIIAQRISSVENADYILVMDNGTINGMGTHEELLKNNKIYQEIFDIQNKIGGNK